MREPHVAADHAIIADHGISAEYCSAGIDDDMIADAGVALNAFDGIAVLVSRERFCALAV